MLNPHTFSGEPEIRQNCHDEYSYYQYYYCSSHSFSCLRMFWLLVVFLSRFFLFFYIFWNLASHDVLVHRMLGIWGLIIRRYKNKHFFWICNIICRKMFLFLSFCVFALFSCRLFLLISVGGRWQTRGVASVKDGWRGGRDGDDFFGGDEGKGMGERGLFLAFCEAGQEMGEDGWSGAWPEVTEDGGALEAEAA